MPATDQRVHTDERTDVEPVEPGFTLGVDPGEADTWEIVRVHCPSCHRPIALINDEERLPQHALLPTAWHPFSASICPGSGALTDELTEVETADEPGDALAALLTLPAELDWRTQPFSHAAVHRAVSAPRVPAQRRR